MKKRSTQMDKLSLRFAEEAALRQIDECTEIEDLRRITMSLVRGHFQARAYIELLLRQSLGLP